MVLLPQGEFATFLRAGDDERRSLLTTLFGTELYDRITRELETRRTAATQDRRAALEAVSLALAAAAEAAGLDGADVTELVDLDPPLRSGALDAMADVLAAADLAAAQERSAASTALAEAETERLAAELQDRLHTELATLLAAVSSHDSSRPSHEARVRDLGRARSAEPVRVLLEQLDTADAEVDAAVAVLVDTLGQPDPAALDGDGAAEHAAAARAYDDVATSLEPLVVLESQATARAARLADAEAVLAACGHRSAALTESQVALPAAIRDAEAARDSAVALVAGLPDAVLRRDDLVVRLRAAQSLHDLEPRLLDAAEHLSLAQDTRRDEVDRYQGLLQRHLDGMASVLAGRLADGDPCAVCGSTVHPRPAAQDAQLVTAEQVEQALHRREKAERIAEKLREEHESLSVERAGLAAVTGTRGVAELQAALAVALELVTRAERESERLPALRADVDELVRRRDDIAEEAAAATRALADAVADERTARAIVEDAEHALVEARAGHPSVSDRQRVERATADRHRAAAAAIADVAQARAARAVLVGRAEAASHDHGFADVLDARTAVRPRDEITVLDTAVTEWTAERTRLSAVAAEARFDGIDARTAEPARRRLALAENTHSEAAARRSLADRHATQAAERLRRFTQRRADIAHAETAAEAVLEATAPVLRLASLAKGTSGELRMSLTTYVLRQWFEQVVTAANHRLAAMSSGRYELDRIDTAEKGERRTGLSLTVIDRHTGECRSPRSLSGGETFYTSLALALGLADVVRAEAGGVELDTLFIDEGFGSLDADTLDQVMGVIDELRDGGRAVGIVSHVDSLKGRIAERLEITSTPGRGSTTTVIA